MTASRSLFLGSGQ